MKPSTVVLIALSLASCAFTELKSVELCISSPQQISNAIQCGSQGINKKSE